jgi:hypothetical protein
MKNIYLLLFFIITVSTFAQSQRFQSNDYAISRSDLETNTFEKDSTANALVIYELGNSYIDKHSFKLNTEFKQKLKIFNRKGFDHANISIYLYNSDDKKVKIKNINATTTNLIDNKVVKTQLKESDIFEEKYNDNYTIIKFTFPNIKEGSVLTYSYTLESPFIYKYKGWNFQSDIPKLHSEYHASIPGNYEYNIKLVGGKKLTTNTSEIVKECLKAGNGGSANCANYVYVMKDIPAFIDEKYMTTRDNYLARIEYELKIYRDFEGGIDNITKNWKTTDKEIKSDPNIGKQLNKSVPSNDILEASILSQTDTLQKAKAIFETVKNKYTWNQEYDLFGDTSIKNVIKVKSGSAPEINILLHNLLEQNNIQVKPILLSTRRNGLPTTVFPVISDFNYLIVQATINNKIYFLDATDSFLNFGQLPFRCLNQYGRLLDFKNGSKWIDIEDTYRSNSRYRVNIRLDEALNITGDVNHITSGQHALSEKKSFFKNANQHQNKLIEKYKNFTISEYQAETTEPNSLEFKENFKINYEVDKIGENIYLDPFLFKFFEENPFKLQERSYPIDFGYKDAFIYSYKIAIDDAFGIVEIPKDVSVKLPENAGLLVFKTSVKDNEIIMYFKLNFNRAIYVKEFYPYLKEIMSTVVNIQNNSAIVLKRK